MHQLVLQWGYLALAGMCVVSAAGIPLGTEFVIAYGGALASGRLPHHLHLYLPWVIAIATVGELVGSIFGYGIGRYGGRELINRAGRYLLLTRADLDRAEQFFARQGAPVVVVGRLVPGIRSFVSFGPGLAKMPLLRFVGFSAIGCAIWCSTLATLGFTLGHSISHVFREFRYLGYGIIALLVVCGIAVVARRVGAMRAERTIG